MIDLWSSEGIKARQKLFKDTLCQLACKGVCKPPEKLTGHEYASAMNFLYRNIKEALPGKPDNQANVAFYYVGFLTLCKGFPLECTGLWYCWFIGELFPDPDHPIWKARAVSQYNLDLISLCLDPGVTDTDVKKWKNLGLLSPGDALIRRLEQVSISDRKSLHEITPIVKDFLSHLVGLCLNHIEKGQDKSVSKERVEPLPDFATDDEPLVTTDTYSEIDWRQVYQALYDRATPSLRQALDVYLASEENGTSIDYEAQSRNLNPQTIMDRVRYLKTTKWIQDIKPSDLDS